MKRDATALRLIECIARGLLGLSGRNIPPAGRDEILASIAAACADHATRRGRAGLVRVAVAELFDLALLPVRSRLAPVDRISNGPHRTPVVFHRGPLMFIDDLRRATRRLRSNVASIALTAAMLAVAIGITAAMFTVLDALVLHPVPFRDAARLTTVVVTRGESYLQTIPRPLFRALRTSGAFAAVEGAIQSPVTLDTGHELVTQAGARITPGMLAMLGVKPILGRGFVEGEGRAGTEDRILLSEGLWQKLFNRDPDVIGRRIRVSGVSTEIVGVLPADFRFPYARAVAWRPIDFDGSSELERMQPMTYARLAPELPAADALRTATAAGRATGVMPEGSQFLFRPIAAGMVDPYSRRSISVLAVAVILVFLVLCANAMNLMLTRFSERQREFGMCSALGASRGRLLREALLETVLLGAAAAMIGLLLANTLIQLVTHYMPEAFLTRTLTPVALNSRALLVTSSLAFLAAAIAGVVPAWMATRVDALESLRLAGRAGTEVPTRRRLAKGLLIAEVALATTLLAGAGLLVRTFVNLTNADRGLNSEGVITGWVSLPSFSFKDRASRLTFAGELEGRLRGLPGVQAASLSGGVPPTHGSIYFGAVQTDAQGATPIEAGEIMVYSVSPQFFELFDIKLLAGRTFSAVSSPDDLILGERLARLLWPTGDAVGRSFQIEGHKTWYRVVGVVREIRNPLLDPRQDSMEIYHPLVVDRNGSAEASTFGSGNVFLALRCGETCPAIPSIAETIRSVSSQVVIAALGPMDEEYREALARPRAAAALGTVFGVVALLAAAGGLFGVLSAAVARRKREFGIRVALGLSPALLGRLVVVDALKLAAAGVGAGLLGAWMLGRGLAALTYEVSAADPQSLAGVCAALTLAIVVASWRPALRASRVDPVALLRED